MENESYGIAVTIDSEEGIETKSPSAMPKAAISEFTCSGVIAYAGQNIHVCTENLHVHVHVARYLENKWTVSPCTKKKDRTMLEV